MNRGRWSASGVGCGGVGCVEARHEASTRYEWSDLIGLQSTPFILMCGIFWVAFFSSHSLVLSAGDRSQVDVAKFSSIPYPLVDGYIYRASLSSVVFLPSHSVTDLHKLGREVLLASLGISTDLIVSRGSALATLWINLKYFPPLRVCLFSRW